MYLLQQDQYVELGSSSGSNQPMMNRTNSKAKLTQSTMTSNDLSDPPVLEHAPNLASFNPSLLEETPQSHRPTTVPFFISAQSLLTKINVFICIILLCLSSTLA
jgi:hypothetical protein